LIVGDWYEVAMSKILVSNLILSNFDMSVSMLSIAGFYDSKLRAQEEDVFSVPDVPNSPKRFDNKRGRRIIRVVLKV
jgi:hypothetical protein